MANWKASGIKPGCFLEARVLSRLQRCSNSWCKFNSFDYCCSIHYFQNVSQVRKQFLSRLVSTWSSPRAIYSILCNYSWLCVSMLRMFPHPFISCQFDGIIAKVNAVNSQSLDMCLSQSLSLKYHGVGANVIYIYIYNINIHQTVNKKHAFSVMLGDKPSNSTVFKVDHFCAIKLTNLYTCLLCTVINFNV